ncbi:L-serine ammonia-lyase [Paraburkholderia sp. RP-4-7]|uniref:L-serine dehydratase n=1 Tax=Paraburkholderia polaris TaxID=2728848 RepID=A0A848IP45_9BURK|nr:L-serine ammonia-lyase [Paraburkholderia polaris]NMM04052.1 L-serine ammonia-lyase [Paraburkholderia polaris]
MVGVFDLFRIGIGPSSSHTVGPMRAGRMFAESLERYDGLPRAHTVQVDLFGSLGATGRGHGSDVGALLGLMGEEPDTIDPSTIGARIAAVRASGRLMLMARHELVLRPHEHIRFNRRALPEHPNAIRFNAHDEAGELVLGATYFSTGSGFAVENTHERNQQAHAVPFPFDSGTTLLAQCVESGLSIAQLMRANEAVQRDDDQITAGILHLWHAMQACVKRGCGVDNDEAAKRLLGPLGVSRRAPGFYRTLHALEAEAAADPLVALDWVSLFAIAVNEENAAGGRVVTAPTNGAAGIIPAVLHYFDRFHGPAEPAVVCDFLLTAAAIGSLYKRNASISGAEVGCQGEVGVACSMAAAGLAAVQGGTPSQVEHAAEIAMEHHLGLTCDPVGGRVQIPCIERNAVGAVKAIHAARMALQGAGDHQVSLDSVIRTMWQTGLDMKSKYKETSRGGLALNVVEC